MDFFQLRLLLHRVSFKRPNYLAIIWRRWEVFQHCHMNNLKIWLFSMKDGGILCYKWQYIFERTDKNLLQLTLQRKRKQRIRRREIIHFMLFFHKFFILSHIYKSSNPYMLIEVTLRFHPGEERMTKLHPTSHITSWIFQSAQLRSTLPNVFKYYLYLKKRENMPICTRI